MLIIEFGVKVPCFFEIYASASVCMATVKSIKKYIFDESINLDRDEENEK